MNDIEWLTEFIRSGGKCLTIRCSSAQARGTAKQYPYYGAVRYELRISKDGRLVNVACERASSDRRSRRLAEQDMREIARREGRFIVQRIGEVRMCDIDGIREALCSAFGSRQLLKELNK